MINLIIKGNMFDAFNASHARGIALITAAQPFGRERPTEVVASCDDSSIDAVRTWFMAADSADIVPGFGYPPGALLFYSTKETAALNDERDAEPRKACVNTLRAHLAQGNRATRRALAADRRLPTEAEGAAWRREHLRRARQVEAQGGKRWIAVRSQAGQHEDHCASDRVEHVSASIARTHESIGGGNRAPQGGAETSRLTNVRLSCTTHDRRTAP